MKHPPSVSKAILRNDFELLLKLGISQHALEKELGFSRSRLTNSDEQLPIWYTYSIMEAAVKLSKDPAFALRMGEITEPANMGIFGYIMMNSPTIRDILNAAVRYYRIARELAWIGVVEERDLCSITFEVEAPAGVKRHIIEKFFATTATFAKMFTAPPAESRLKLGEGVFSISSLRLAYDPPAYLSEYTRIFNCPIRFNQRENALVFKRKFLDLLNPQHNLDIRRVLTQHAEQLLDSAFSRNNLQGHIRKFIVQHIHKGAVGIEMFSEKMKISRWTINRRLKEEGTTFKEIFTGLRKELAIEYLQNSSFSILEIAYLLGFSEPQSFPRAFKKWTGSAPLEFRNDLMKKPMTRSS